MSSLLSCKEKINDINDINRSVPCTKFHFHKNEDENNGEYRRINLLYVNIFIEYIV